MPDSRQRGLAYREALILRFQGTQAVPVCPYPEESCLEGAARRQEESRRQEAWEA